MKLLDPEIEAIQHLQSREVIGTVTAVRGLSLLVDDLPLPVGALVRLEHKARTPSHETSNSDRGEIIGFDGRQTIVSLFGSNTGITPGTRVIGEQSAQVVQVGACMLGRVINAMGQPIDDGSRLMSTVARPLSPEPITALSRSRIYDPLPTGVRAIDAFHTIGKGQRLGIFSGAGIGKSTLLASIARNTDADVNVIALVGERGREVRDFIERALGAEGLSRSVVVVATGDESPLLRVRAAQLACAVAEHFRDQNLDVMLMMDSVTRFAMAQRQIGLTVGEQPATKGYTPSVFALLPQLLERAGNIEGGGSITGLFSILVEGDDLADPVSDAARGILDGHIVLSRRLASAGHYPAIDVTQSISRLADDICDEHHVAARRLIVRLLAAYAEAEELINIGAYSRGSNVDCDVAIQMKREIGAYLQQPSDEKSPYAETCRDLIVLAEKARQYYAQHDKQTA